MKKFNKIMNVMYAIGRQLLLWMTAANGIIAFAEAEVCCEGAFILVGFIIITLWIAKNAVNEVSLIIKDGKTETERK